MDERFRRSLRPAWSDQTPTSADWTAGANEAVSILDQRKLAVGAKVPDHATPEEGAS
jgi:hypothetical protein